METGKSLRTGGNVTVLPSICTVGSASSISGSESFFTVQILNIEENLFSVSPLTCFWSSQHIVYMWAWGNFPRKPWSPSRNRVASKEIKITQSVHDLCSLLVLIMQKWVKTPKKVVKWFTFHGTRYNFSKNTFSVGVEKGSKWTALTGRTGKELSWEERSWILLLTCLQCPDGWCCSGSINFWVYLAKNPTNCASHHWC